MLFNNKRNHHYIHVLVLTAFVGIRPTPETQTRHYPDRNPSNNRIENLRWGTHLENQQDQLFHKTVPIGEQNHAAKLTEDFVRIIRNRAKRGVTKAMLARQFEVDKATISDVVSGHTWKHII